MKRIFLMALTVLTIAGCGSADKQSQLKELEAKRDEINLEIKQLLADIALENGENAPDNTVFISLQTVKPSVFRHYIKTQGTVTSDNNILIPAQLDGVIKSIYVTEGEQVKAGQLLGQLDGAIYEKNITELKTSLDLARTIFERQERLWEKKIGSEIQYLQAKNNKDALEARLATLEETYRLTKIIAPISGTVDQILVKEGEGIGAGFGTVRVVKVSQLKIESFLSENYINQVHSGDSVNVYIPVLDKSFASVIRSVSQVIDSKNRTFPVEVKIPAGMQSVKPNLMAILTINDYTKAGAITAPVNVVQNTGESKFLFTAKLINQSENIWKVVKKQVTTGLNYDGIIELTNGLQPDEYIVTVGYQNLADGQNVRVSDAKVIAGNQKDQLIPITE
ncbi:MAG: efflux RND transporter periplasmic adaptor subunit [Calditrichaceae bacterium]